VPDEEAILADFRTILLRWSSRYPEEQVYDVIRRIYDPLYREEITPPARKRMLNRIKKQTVLAALCTRSSMATPGRTRSNPLMPALMALAARCSAFLCRDR
jgi:hypothetical protein